MLANACMRLAEPAVLFSEGARVSRSAWHNSVRSHDPLAAAAPDEVVVSGAVAGVVTAGSSFMPSRTFPASNLRRVGYESV
jgi:hypothetical protein